MLLCMDDPQPEGNSDSTRLSQDSCNQSQVCGDLGKREVTSGQLDLGSHSSSIISLAEGLVINHMSSLKRDYVLRPALQGTVRTKCPEVSGSCS